MDHYTDLLSNINQIENDNIMRDIKIDRKRKLYNEYTRKFTTPPNIWLDWIRMEKTFFNPNKPETVEILNELRKAALSHFFDEKFCGEVYIKDNGALNQRFPENNQIFCKVFSLPHYEIIKFKEGSSNVHLLEESMAFPHRHLEDIKNHYIEKRGLFIPEKVRKDYKKNLELAKKLDAALNNEDAKEWFKLLKETRDDEIIIQNMEYFIAKNNQQKDAWKLYIKFLKEKNSKAMLGVYSRYCRFFVDDMSMLEEYCNQILDIQKTGRDVTDWILDIFDIISCNSRGCDMQQLKLLEGLNEAQMNKYTTSIFKYDGYKQRMKHCFSIETSDIWVLKKEFNFMKMFDIQIFQEQDKRKPVNPKSSLKWSNSNMKSQNLSFHSNFIHYILDDPLTRFKLYQTCKYFYYKYEAPFVVGVYTDDTEDVAPVECVTYYLEFSCNFFDNPDALNDTTVSEYLQKNVITNIYLKAIPNRLFCSKIMKFPAIKFNLKYLSLEKQNLTMDEIKFINHNSQSIFLSLKDVNIYESNGSFAKIEDIVTEFCHATYIIINCPNLVYTSLTTEKLLNLPKKNKFKTFKIYCATVELNLENFCQFLKKFADRECHLLVNFTNEHANFGRQFTKALQNLCTQWNPKRDAPILINA